MLFSGEFIKKIKCCINVLSLTSIKFWNESLSVADGVLVFINLSKEIWDTRT